MKVLLLGSGGREHALAWKLAQSPRLTTLFALPGNPGIARYARCLEGIPLTDHDAIVTVCGAEDIDLVVVGPEAPLVDGIADRLIAEGIPVFGPTQVAAQLEGSKLFTKELCKAHGIPTAAFGRFAEPAGARAFVEAQGAPIVLKADGLMAGKGVIVAMTLDEALKAVDEVFAMGVPGTEILDRGISGGRGGQLLLPGRWRDRAAVRLGAGPQARLRRRPGAEHRRHGRLFPGAGLHAPRSSAARLPRS